MIPGLWNLYGSFSHHQTLNISTLLSVPASLTSGWRWQHLPLWRLESGGKRQESVKLLSITAGILQLGIVFLCFLCCVFCLSFPINFFLPSFSLFLSLLWSFFVLSSPLFLTFCPSFCMCLSSALSKVVFSSSFSLTHRLYSFFSKGVLWTTPHLFSVSW